jgi:hypothetical protein
MVSKYIQCRLLGTAEWGVFFTDDSLYLMRILAEPFMKLFGIFVIFVVQYGNG